MAIRKRNIVLRVPVTAEERALIERKMQQMGTGCLPMKSSAASMSMW